MKITEKQLRGIIKESIKNVLVEAYDPNLSSDDIDYITGNFHRRQRANSVKEEYEELNNDLQNRARKAFQETFNDLKLNYNIGFDTKYRPLDAAFRCWSENTYPVKDLVAILKIMKEREDTFKQNLVKNGLPCKGIRVVDIKYATDVWYTQFIYVDLEITEKIERYARIVAIMSDNEY